MNCVWQVQIRAGATDVDVSAAPTKFGTPQVSVGDDNSLSDVGEPLLYGPVGVRSESGWMCLEVPEEPVPEPGRPGTFRLPTRLVREMTYVHQIEFTGWGHVRIEGLEERKDGAMVRAVWEIEPYYDDDESTDGQPAEG